MSHNIIRTKIPNYLKELPVISVCTYRAFRPEFKSPEALLELCIQFCNTLPLPDSWEWTPEDVADWVASELGFPEFREVFTKNLISGKRLLLLEMDKLARVNIQRFQVMKLMTSAIRKLYKIDQDEFKRSISLPSRRPETLYLWHRAGNHRDPMTRSQLLNQLESIYDQATRNREFYSLLSHWERIPPYRAWCPHVSVGSNRRVSSMTCTTRRQNFHPAATPARRADVCVYSLCQNKG